MNRFDEEKKYRKEAGSAVIGFTALVIFIFIADAGIIYFQGFNTKTILVSASSIVFVLGAVAVYIDYYRKYIKPSKDGEASMTQTITYRTKEMYNKRGGRDMYEICDGYRKRMRNNGLIIIAVCAFILPALMLLGAWQSGLDIPAWVAVVMGLGILIISVVLSWKTDFGFKTVEDLKKAVADSGFDPVRVNEDFMSASYHDLFKGLLAIGLNYYVIHCDNLSCIGDIKSIKSVEAVSKIGPSKAEQENKITRHYVIIHENNIVYTLVCKDRMALELIASEFSKDGVKVES